MARGRQAVVRARPVTAAVIEITAEGAPVRPDPLRDNGVRPMNDTPRDAAPRAAPFLVCGMGHVGFRIVELLTRLGEPVVVVTRETRGEWMRAAAAAGATVVTGDARDTELLRASGLGEARALLAVTDRDPVNLEIALDAKRLRPDLPVVARLFDQNLAQQLEATHGVRRALSVSALAAPAFAGAALGESVLASFASGGKLDVVVRESGRLLVLEEHEARARLESRRDARPTERRPLSSGLARVWSSAPLGLRYVFAALIGLTALSVFVFSWGMDLSLVDAFYFVVTTVTTVGYGDITPLKASPALKLFGCLVMVLGSATLATLTSILTAFVVTERFERLLGRGRVPASGHVVVVGYGNVGSRTAAELVRAGVAAVAVDADAGAASARTVGARTAVVIGDARRPGVLEDAHIATARAVVAVTGDDAVNLGVALLARKLNPGIRTVLRLFDAGLAAKVQAGLDVDVAMGAARVAAPMFVAAALEEGVEAAVVEGGALHVLLRTDTGLSWSRRPLAP
jgi:voltage-gated potassium channel Kch